MISPEQIQEIVAKVAVANLGRASIEGVMSEPTADSRGDEALRITIVLAPGVVERISGDTVLDTLVQIQRRLGEAGENRLAMVGYATRAELEEVGDT
jgi:hypothetical protein